MFIDNVKIYVKSGPGGKGCQSFYRDKYTRYGIPDGGDGGKGGDIIIRADRNLHTLYDFQFNRHFRATHGAHGSGNKRKGKDAPDVIVLVPCGTIVKDAAIGCVLRDLKTDGDQVIAAIGGKGGRGNHYHREATLGGPGEEKEVLLDLSLIADVGVIGFPNAGKSTLVSQISNAHPKIAGYPFTTVAPVLGLVRPENGAAFIVADIPGLIEGSSHGRGLGDRFLRHVSRTKVLIHLVDMAGFEGRNPISDYKIINQELKACSKELAAKPQVLAANKMDLEPAAKNLAKFRKAIKKKIYPISALKKEGLEELVEAIRKKL